MQSIHATLFLVNFCKGDIYFTAFCLEISTNSDFSYTQELKNIDKIHRFAILKNLLRFLGSQILKYFWVLLSSANGNFRQTTVNWAAKQKTIKTKRLTSVTIYYTVMGQLAQISTWD